MKFEINVTLETETEDRFDDILTQLVLFFGNKANTVDCTLEFKKVEDNLEI